jgi:hypothetical protein
MNTAIQNWKTSTAGVALGAGVLVALGAYKQGMTIGQWLAAAGLAVLAALPGILAHDGQPKAS